MTRVQNRVSLDGPPALFGREREQQLLLQELEEAAHPGATVVMLAGDPGAGKTSLLDTAAAEAAKRGWLVLRAGLGEAVAQPPYALFIQALRPFAAENGSVAAVLKDLQPREKAAGEPGEFLHLRLYEAVGDAIETLAAGRPIAIFFDDLQWSDPSSLLLLTHVLRRGDSIRLFVAGSYRDVEFEKNDAAVRFLAEQNRRRRLRTISVKPLPPAALADLCRHVLNGPISSRLLRVVNDYSEGNPFFAEELLRGWQERDEIVEKEGIWTIPSGKNPPPPRAVMFAVRQQLATLEAETVDALRFASIIGRSFSTELLALSTKIWLARVEEILEPALAAGLLRQGEGDDLEFRHDIVRASLSEELSVFRRRQFHYSIGMALESIQNKGKANYLPELAFHYARSGNRERSAHYAVEAARSAMNAFAYLEARDLFQTALDNTGPSDAARGDLLLDLGNALLLIPEAHAAEATFEEAFRWFSTKEDWRGAGISAAQRARSLWRREALPEATTAFDEAMRYIDSLDARSAAALLADYATFLGVSLGRMPDAIDFARRAIDAAAQIEDRPLEALSRRTLGNLLARGAGPAEGIEALQIALDLAVAAGAFAEAAECCACLVSVGIWNGDPTGSYDAALQQVRYAELSHDLHQLRHVYCWLAMLAAGIGRHGETAGWFEKAKVVVGRLDNPEATAFLYQSMGTVALWREEFAGAVEAFEKTVDILRPNGQTGVVWYLGPLGVSQVGAGDLNGARRTLIELDTFLGSFDEEGALEMETLTAFGLIAAKLGDKERGRAAYERLKRYTGRSATFFASRVLAEIAFVLGDLERAAAHVLDAETETRAMNFLPELAAALRLKADIELAAGRTVGAKAALLAAREICEKAGLPIPSAAIGTLLDSLEHQKQTVSNAQGMSERELEVLRLVVAGKTNPEIAGILSISRKTVANHLTSILSKTGTDNRAAATAFAIRNGLA